MTVFRVEVPLHGRPAGPIIAHLQQLTGGGIHTPIEVTSTHVVVLMSQGTLATVVDALAGWRSRSTPLIQCS